MLSWGDPHCQPEFFLGVPHLAGGDPFTTSNNLPGGAFQSQMEPLGLTPRMMQGTCAAPTPPQPSICHYGGQQPWASGVSQMQGMITTSPMVTAGYPQACWTSPTQGLNNFTFTSPTATQGNTVFHSFQPLQSQVAAPGMGVSWQHAVPKQMPWVLDSSFSRPELVNFSGVPLNMLSMTQNGHFQSERAGNQRRLKRSADDGSIEPPSKMHVSEERMAAELQGLYITEKGVAAELQGLYITEKGMAAATMTQDPQTSQPLEGMEGQMLGVQQTPLVDWPVPGQEPLNRSQMWERYKEVERRLAVSQEEEEDSDEDEKKEKGVLKILCDGINKNIETPTVFPTPSLSILENNINREKSMQLVLWKPSPLSGMLASGSASSSEEEEEEDFSHSESRDALNSLTNNNNVDCLDSMDIELMDNDDLDL